MDAFLFPAGETALEQKTLHTLLACNEKTAPYGLSLTQQDVSALLGTRRDALTRSGRVELGGETVLEKLILAFCDSPYLSQFDYADTLQELTELFYTAKTETAEGLTDDELLRWMVHYFNTCCKGSVNLLWEHSLEDLARAVREGRFDLEDALEEEVHLTEEDIDE